MNCSLRFSNSNNGNLLSDCIAKLKLGLNHSSIGSCDEWSCKYRIMGSPYPGNWSFDHHLWLKEMHNCDAPMIIGQKAAQMGFTETALNRAFYKMDKYGHSVLYVLPAKVPDAADFSASRFDPAIDLAPYIKNMFSNVKNVGHKRAGSCNLYIRGSKSRSSLKSVPVSLVIADELDEFDQDNIPMIFERMSGQLSKQFFAISTPTIPDYGINKFYKESNQSHFFFNCPYCGKTIELLLPESLKDGTIICNECKHVLPHETKPEWLKTGRWIPQSKSDVVGFQINQLYSCTTSPSEIQKALEAASKDPAAEQEFYNSKKGEPHIVNGARLNLSDIESRCRPYGVNTLKPKNATVVMGIDVGKQLHYEIDAFYVSGSDTLDPNANAYVRLVSAGTVDTFEALNTILRDFQPRAVVIDANPETRKSQEFCAQFPGLAYMCYYTRGNAGRRFRLDDLEGTVKVDRTSWLDLSLNRFRNETIEIPHNITADYKEHLQTLVKVFKKDNTGNVVAEYMKSNNRDHFAHTRNYCEIAYAISAGRMGNCKDI